MSRQRRFISLNLKMTAAIMLGIIMAIATYALCSGVESYVTQVRYQSEAAIEKNVGEAYDSLQAYIKEKKVEATDTEALSAWLKNQEYTYFLVYDDYGNVFESGWWTGSDSYVANEGVENEESNLYQSGISAAGSEFPEDVQNRIVEFADGSYYTYINVYKEQHWHDIMVIVRVVLCFLALLLTILIYNGRTLKRIINLANEVQHVSDGKLDFEIHAGARDEIGSLAIGVDNMRNSLIQKHENEREAWEANTQLITAMSHDIRTPLTSMIGYLDIIEGKKYNTQEELDKYISSCRDKAFQLKDLSDKLFQYFLVFGNKPSDRNLEYFDASILFQQILAEHCAEAVGYDYRIDFQYTVPEVGVMVDISSLRRLFDNVFSNIMKYADRKDAILVQATAEEDDVHILIRNRILEQAKKVESTRIGLKTCEKICSDLGGNFEYCEEEYIFTVQIHIPITEESDTEEME